MTIIQILIKSTPVNREALDHYLMWV